MTAERVERLARQIVRHRVVKPFVRDNGEEWEVCCRCGEAFTGNSHEEAFRGHAAHLASVLAGELGDLDAKSPSVELASNSTLEQTAAKVESLREAVNEIEGAQFKISLEPQSLKDEVYAAGTSTPDFDKGFLRGLGYAKHLVSSLLDRLDGDTGGGA